jgi:hypothetical protein
MLKYRLRGLGEAARWSRLYLDPSVAEAWEAFQWCHRLDLLSLAVTLPLVGVTWRGYTAPAPIYGL